MWCFEVSPSRNAVYTSVATLPFLRVEEGWNARHLVESDPEKINCTTRADLCNGFISIATSNLHNLQLLTSIPQIWFQNKRQSARRKSKPLLRHEFSAEDILKSAVGAASVRDPLRSSSALGTSEPSSPVTLPALGRHAALELGERPSLPSISRSTSFTFLSESDRLPSMRNFARLPLGDLAAERNVRSEMIPRVESPYEVKDYTPRPSLPRLSTHDALQAALSSDSPPPISAAPTLHRRATTGSFRPPNLHRRSSSFLRLSTSIEGKASIIGPVPDLTPDVSEESQNSISTSSSPSSPLPNIPSSSAATVTEDPHPHANSPLPAQLTRRSSSKTNSKVWEFLCDNRGSPSINQPEEATTALSLLRAKEGSIVDTPTPTLINRKRRVLQQVQASQAPTRVFSESGLALQGRKRKFEAPNGAKGHARNPSQGGLVVKKKRVNTDKENFVPVGGVAKKNEGDEVEVGELLLSLRGGNWGTAV